jgi:hypothetical protein
VISDHAVGSCQPQRTEFRRSARNLDEYEQMTAMYVDLYPDVAVPKTAWQWVESAQTSAEESLFMIASLEVTASSDTPACRNDNVTLLRIASPHA